MTRIISCGKIVALGLVAAALSGCGRAADLSCADIVSQATDASQKDAVKIVRVHNVTEVSKTDKERRCTGTAETSVGTNLTVNFRGYEENGNQLVSYEGSEVVP